MNWLAVSEATDHFWDVIIVGSGIGGATVASAAAVRGKKVLVITKTDSLLWQDFVHDRNRGMKLKPFLGDGFGGSSQLYGMVMERLDANDFEDRGGSWPESLGSWEPYYQAAEKLFLVEEAKPQNEFAPLYERFQSQGFEVSPLRLASRQKPDCDYCQSKVCTKDCKVTVENGPLRDLRKSPNLSLVSAEVLDFKFVASENVELRFKKDGRLFSVRGRNVVLSAGALRTPTVLRASSNLPAIGCYFMRHLVDCYALNWPALGRLDPQARKRLASAKAWGTHTLYRKDEINLGTIQAFGSFPDFDVIWDEYLTLNPALRFVPFSKSIAAKVTGNIFSHPVASSIVEDEAQAQNRIESRRDGGVDLFYRVSENDRKKIDYMRSAIKKALGPYLFKFLPQAENNFRLAHACGTCRIGESRTNSVVNRWGMVHEKENVWIADASVFPASSGKNPALTIAAHSLRLVDEMLGRNVPLGLAGER